MAVQFLMSQNSRRVVMVDAWCFTGAGLWIVEQLSGGYLPQAVMARDQACWKQHVRWYERSWQRFDSIGKAVRSADLFSVEKRVSKTCKIDGRQRYEYP